MKPKDINLSPDYLKSIFDYKDGQLYWKKPNSNVVKIGQKAGSLSADGYVSVRVNDAQYKAHRLIYLMHHGKLPRMLDHIDCNRANNRIENLREASLSQNRMNSTIAKNNTSGSKGVWWNKVHQKWQVCIRKDNKSNYLGTYSNKEEAIQVANKYREQIHAEFCRHN